MGNRSVGLGLGSGMLFAVSAVCYRGASLEIASDDPVIRAGLTLGKYSAGRAVITIQIFMDQRGVDVSKDTRLMW